MPRQTGRLSALALSRPMSEGLHPDGSGLYIRATGAGGKFWVFRFMLHGKAREMGLGALHALSATDARKKATDARKMLSDGIDPIEARNSEQTKQQLEEARKQTFKQCAEAYIESNRAAWRNPKSETQWRSSLKTYAYPIIGDLAVQDIDVSLVLKVLEQKQDRFKDKKFWVAVPETANRVRTRLECVLDWATAREYRRGENPARWRGHLENLLPKKSKLKGVKHHNALPYSEVARFICELKKLGGIGVNAFELLILTASRTNEVLKAQWCEFDLENKIWTIPAGRTKREREHRVPLSERAVTMLKAILPIDNYDKNAYVFPGQRGGAKSLSKMGLLSLLKRMGLRKTITVHGFRSTFRDWCAEQTAFPEETAKSALSHVGGDKVDIAYKRTDLFEKRRRLMDEWGNYCGKPPMKEDKKVSKISDIRKIA